jgi:hypothetical protein
LPSAGNAQSWNVISSALQDANVTVARALIYGALVANFGINPVSNDSFAQSAFAKQPGAYLTGYPMILNIQRTTN